MATGSYTHYDIGLRKNVPAVATAGEPGSGERNFEPALALAGSVQYSAKVQWPGGLWWVDGSTYNKGTALPFDQTATSPHSYTPVAVAMLQRYWDQDWISPTT